MATPTSESISSNDSDGSERGWGHIILFVLLFALLDGSMLSFYLVRQGWIYFWHTLANIVRKKALPEKPQHFRSFVRLSEIGRGFLLVPEKAFQILELARIDFFGYQQTLYDSIQRGNMPVLAGCMTHFTCSLHPFEPYDVETRMVHYNHRFIYMTQTLRSLLGSRRVCCICVNRVAFVKRGKAVDPVQDYTDTSPETLSAFNELMLGALPGCLEDTKVMKEAKEALDHSFELGKPLAVETLIVANRALVTTLTCQPQTH